MYKRLYEEEQKLHLPYSPATETAPGSVYAHHVIFSFIWLGNCLTKSIGILSVFSGRVIIEMVCLMIMDNL